MRVRKKLFSQERKETLSGIGIVGLVYGLGGRWKEADKLQLQEMKTSQKVLGEEHPDALTSMANLASTYSNQGRWKEAEELDMQVMEIRQKVLGKEHPDTLTSMNNSCFHLERLRPIYRGHLINGEMLSAAEQVLDPEHLYM
ncbi:hypothetical protein ABVK25_009923 [Lepraria finkii]|uniref:Kinesin light chain n=1 Tax=Lepraria finkii TaxID=1340010 RepID=A0ABR4AVX9_9LECA